jgi:hypothetical protein
MTKKTRKKIIKAFMFARGLFLALFVFLALFGALCADSAGVLNTIIIFAIAAVCFAISFFCDILLGGYKSPFYY